MHGSEILYTSLGVTQMNGSLWVNEYWSKNPGPDCCKTRVPVCTSGAGPIVVLHGRGMAAELPKVSQPLELNSRPSHGLQCPRRQDVDVRSCKRMYIQCISMHQHPRKPRTTPSIFPTAPWQVHLRLNGEQVDALSFFALREKAPEARKN